MVFELLSVSDDEVFVVLAHEYINCSRFEEIFFNCSSEYKGAYLSNLLTVPEFDKAKIRDELIKLADIEALTNYYKLSPDDVDVKMLVEMAIKSKNAHSIFLVAFNCFVELYCNEENETEAKKMENAFLRYCISPELALGYICKISCYYKERFVELLIRLNGDHEIYHLYKESLPKDKKRIYQLAMNFGTLGMQNKLRKATPFYKRILWKLF